MTSIRTFLLTRLLGGAALVLAGAGVAVYLAVARSLEAQFDDNLSDRVQSFASILFQQGDEVEFEFSGQLMPEFEAEHDTAYFELWYEDGLLLERSESLGSGDLEHPETVTRAPQHWTAPLPDGRSGRYVAQRIEVHHVYPEEGPGRPNAAQLLIVVARGREPLVAAERTVMLQCAIASLLLIGLIALISWQAVERGLEPARRLATTLDAIRVDALPEALEVGELPSELVPVADKTDALIQRLDQALKRERRTTADIAHELRTPISEVLTVSEVALRDAGDHAGARRALGTLRDIGWRMGRSVSTLLKLARLEMGAETLEREPVDLERLVSDLLRSLASLERERGLRLENGLAAGQLVRADRDVLGIVVSNLLGNALYYSPEGGAVQCHVEGGEEDWTFVVENDAGDLRPQDLVTLTEPFWRKDRARADRNRSGLGLALSHALAGKTGMALEFELEGPIFRARLSSRPRPPGEAGSRRSASRTALSRATSGTNGGAAG